MYKIFNEDCWEGLKRLPDKSIDFILTDLPYNVLEYDRNKKPLDLNLLWQELRGYFNIQRWRSKSREQVA